MKTPHRLQKITHTLWLTTILLLATTLLTTAILPALARTSSPSKPRSSLKIRWKPPIPPSSLGIPGNRAQGGGTRGCQSDRNITALVPKLPQNIYWGRTIDNRPTVWLNAPQGLERDVLMEIAVRERDGQTIAKQSFTTNQKIAPGAIGIPFPPTTMLQVARTYDWTVALYCDTNELVDSPTVISGQIQRIAAPTALTAARSSLERIQILAENGIWYDALTQLGDRLRQTKDRRLSAAWSALLKSAEIKGSDRIQNCCQLD